MALQVTLWGHPARVYLLLRANNPCQHSLLPADRQGSRFLRAGAPIASRLALHSRGRAARLLCRVCFYLVAQPGRRVVHTLHYRRWQYLASLPCTAAGGQPGSCEQFPLCQQACPTQQRGGQSGSSEQFPLCQQATPAGRLAGGRASTSRLLPHDPFRQASSTRLPFQDFSRAARLRYN